MAKVANRVQMTVSGTPGTGAITLLAALTGYQSFLAGGILNGDVVSYAIIDGANWEYGWGTYTTAGTSLARTTILGSSNAGAAISATSAAIVILDILAQDCKVLLATLTASASASLIDNTHFTADFNDYELVFEDLLMSGVNVNSLSCQIYLSGVLLTASSYFNNGTSWFPTTSAAWHNTGNTNWGISEATNGNGLSGWMKFFNANGIAAKTMQAQFQQNVNGVGAVMSITAGHATSTSALTGVKLFPSPGGTFTSGVVKIYGSN